MTWSPPPLKITIPEGALTQGICPPLPDGMFAWKNRKNGYLVVVCGYQADPIARTKEWWDKATQGMRPHEIDAEYLCSFASRGGMKVFPWIADNPGKFTRPHSDYRSGHVWKIPHHWPMLGCLDFGGTRNPTAFYICAIDEKKIWHVIDEYYRPSHYRDTADFIKEHPLYDRLIKIVIDPSMFKRDQHVVDRPGAFTSVAELLQEAGVDILERGQNDRAAGLARVMDQFNQRPGETRPTKILISDDCPHLFEEFSELVYKQESELQLVHRNPSDDVEKKNDHGYDAVRYALMSWDTEAEYDLPRSNNPFSLENLEAEIDEAYDSKVDDLFN